MALLTQLALMAYAADVDGDGFDDDLDVCPLVADPGQLDTDGDGTGDACDVCVGPADGLTRYPFPGAYLIQQYNQGYQPLVVEDVDADGDPDLAFASDDWNQGGLWLARGQGGTFSPLIRTLRAPIASIVSGDLDGDGDADLVVVERDPVRILLVELQAGAVAGVHPLSTPEQPVHVTLEDLDGDGDLDLLTSNTVAVHARPNRGGFSFGPASSLIGRTTDGVPAAGDLDGDGDVDLVVRGDDDVLRWYANDGTGLFVERSDLGVRGSSPIVADLDGDGRDDVIWDDGDVVWRRQLPTGVLGLRQVLETRGSLVALEDGDGDGDLDLFLGGTRGELLWRENLAGGVFAADVELIDAPVFSYPYGVRAVDIDLDGTRDLVVDWDDGLRTYRGLPCAAQDTDGDGLTDAIELLRLGTAANLADTDADGLADAAELAVGADARVADTDGDGQLDGADACPVDAPNDPDGDGICQSVDNCATVANPGQVDLDEDAVGDACDPCFGLGADTDGDRWCDDTDVCALVADPGQADADGDGAGDACDVCPEFGDGLTPLGLPATLPTPASPDLILQADLDGDGDLDLVAADQYSTTVQSWWFENLGGGAYAASQPTTLGPAIAQMAAADLDGDGDLDLVATLGGTQDSVVWAPNRGDGTFDPVVTLGAEAEPTGLVVEDLDGDGDVDLAVGVADAGEIARYTNDGVGGFTRSIVASGLLRPVELVAADVDADGARDLVVRGYGAGVQAISWLRRTGAVFGAPTLISSDCRNCEDLTAGDLDGDGDVELVLASEVGVGLLEGLGGGAFAPLRRLSLTSDNRYREVALVDLDLDGDDDLVVATNQAIRWSTNEGGLVFGDPASSPMENHDAYELAGMDTDGDGVLDVVVGDRTGVRPYPVLSCAAQDTDGDGLTDATELQVWGSDPVLADTDADGLDDGDEIAAGADPLIDDTDGDGILDGADTCPLSVEGDVDGDGFCGDADNCPTVASADQSDADGDGVGDVCDLCVGDDASGDFDGDGLCDTNDNCAFVANPGQGDADGDGTGNVCDACVGPSDGVAWFAGAPQQFDWCPGWAEICLWTTYRSTAADLDGDGDLDPIYDSVDGPSGVAGALSWYRNNGGSIGQQARLLLTADDLRDVVIDDLDGDGDPDVAVASVTEGLVWALNDGNGVFAAPRTVGPAGLTTLVAADLDGDGDLDLAVGSALENAVGWYRNTPAGFVPAAVLTSAATDPTGLAAADVDDDGDIDLIGVSSGDDEIAWYENLGGGTFAPQRIVTHQVTEPLDVFAGDLDGDGWVDLVTGSTDGTIVGLYGDGAGGFSAPVTLAEAQGGPLYRFVANDPDGDGDLDVTAVWGSYVWWLPNIDGRLGAPQQVVAGATAWPADLDGDGDPDLIAGGGSDAYWVEGYGTCASRDTDADGLTNGEELLVFACDPLDPDTDGGGTDDGIEVLVTGTDPRDPSDD
ncbi:MAG: VCBS repeat-containing protein [Alphaproteobacteria bacterium]|nr:VCBS repeat-containing protein [Alphaproteobacteria bacterium]MCB9695208.1 VCBS repeat-containing protein [Alphaproteobacteria bacterium]